MKTLLSNPKKTGLDDPVFLPAHPAIQNQVVLTAFHSQLLMDVPFCASSSCER